MEENQDVKRPGIGTVIGILSIIFCSIGLIGGLIGLVGVAVANSLFSTLPANIAEEAQIVISTVNKTLSLSLILVIVQTLLRAAGLTGGIGLLGNKRWSIVVSDVYAGGMIVLLIVNFFVTKNIVEKIFQDPVIMAELEAEGEFAVNFIKRVITGFSGTVSIILGSIYPIVVLALINLPSVRKFYANPPEPQKDTSE